MFDARTQYLHADEEQIEHIRLPFPMRKHTDPMIGHINSKHNSPFSYSSRKWFVVAASCHKLRQCFFCTLFDRFLSDKCCYGIRNTSSLVLFPPKSFHLLSGTVCVGKTHNFGYFFLAFNSQPLFDAQIRLTHEMLVAPNVLFHWSEAIERGVGLFRCSRVLCSLKCSPENMTHKLF